MRPIIWLCLFYQDQLYYSIVGDDIAQQFFYMDTDTGVITLKRLLTDDTSLQYNVSTIRESSVQFKYYKYSFSAM